MLSNQHEDNLKQNKSRMIGKPLSLSLINFKARDSISIHLAFLFVRYNSLFTARKRSLGQGNVFTPVCDSVQRGSLYPGEGVLYPAGLCPRGICLGGCLCPGVSVREGV